MAKKSKKPARQSRWASDAALQALVRYGPETSGLKELARQAQENRDVTIRQAHGSAAAALGAIDTARPEVAGIYDDAGLRQAATASLLGSQTAGLSGVADPIKAAIAAETAQGSRHLTEMRASNLADLSNRRVQARSGEQFAVQGAQQKFVQDMAKVLARQQDLAGERGAFEASTVNSLEQAALERGLRNRTSLRSTRSAAANSRRSASQSERNSLRSSGIDPDTGKPIPGGKLDPKVKARDRADAAKDLPGGVKPNTRAMHGRVTDQVKSMESWIREHKGDYRSRHEIARDLLNGVPASTITDPKTGAKIKDPGVPKAPSQLALQAALDVVYNGGLSGGTSREFHRRGYSVATLGLPSGTKVKPPPKRTTRRAARAVPGVGSFRR